MTYARVLRTLRRIPADIVLSMMTRDMNVNVFNTCICGWAMRESAARIHNVDANDVDVSGMDSHSVVEECVLRFGGTFAEWSDVYTGVIEADHFPIIERAFATRLTECV